MTNTQRVVGESSSGGEVARRGSDDEATTPAQFTKEQIEVLEKVFADCSSADQFQNSRILLEEPILAGVDTRQLNVWFRNRRFRDRQRREKEELSEENRRLSAAKKTLRRKNNGLQRRIAHLTAENESLQNQVISLNSIIPTNDLADVPIASQMPRTTSDNNNSLHSLAEETRNEFLAKAIGTAINWNPIPRLTLHGPGSACTVYISSACIGVAARACTVLPFEPVKVIEILKDRPTWSRDCRKMAVVATYPAINGGMIEILYTQLYALTTMACSRDFYTMRYTSILDNGSFVVCETSVSGSNIIPSSPADLEFVRAKMLACGYLVCSCDGGSIITLVDHLDFEASSVPVLVRPLYNSPETVAKRMTLSALHYVRQLANRKDANVGVACPGGPTYPISFNKRLSRGFNDAVNGYIDDGWRWMNADASNDVIVSLKETNNFGANAKNDSIICVKTSFLLHDISPANVVTLLKEHRSAWMKFDFAKHAAAFSEAVCHAYPGHDTHNISEGAVKSNPTKVEDEMFEVIRFERYPKRRPNISSRDIYHMQISNGMEDTGFGACSELIFAPFDSTMPNDADLLCSGFRIYLLSENTVENGRQGIQSSANVASNSNDVQLSMGTTSLCILAFQFPSGTHIQEQVATLARKYVQHVISYVKNLSPGMLPPRSNSQMDRDENNPATGFKSTQVSNYAVRILSPRSNSQMDHAENNPDTGFKATPESNDAVGILPPGSNSRMHRAEKNPATGFKATPESNYAVGVLPPGSNSHMDYAEKNPATVSPATPESNYAADLANLIAESYRSMLGMEMPGLDSQTAVSQSIQNHQYAILCFSFTSTPVIMYANQAGFDMLGTTPDKLQCVSVDKILGGSGDISLAYILPTIMRQGYYMLPSGCYITEMNYCVTYEQAVVWLVRSFDDSIHCLAAAFTDCCSFS